MYKLAKPLEGQIESKKIIRLSDNAFIPMDADNADYQEYLKWIEAGNEPLPADE